jgi:hypothetical protein
MKAAQDEEKVVYGVLLSHNFSVVNSNLWRIATQVAHPVRIAQQQGVQRGGDSGEVVGSELSKQDLFSKNYVGLTYDSFVLSTCSLYLVLHRFHGFKKSSSNTV